MGPDKMGTGAAGWGLGSGGSQGGDCGFEGILARPALVTKWILLLEPRGQRTVTYEVCLQTV